MPGQLTPWFVIRHAIRDDQSPKSVADKTVTRSLFVSMLLPFVLLGTTICTSVHADEKSIEGNTLLSAESLSADESLNKSVNAIINELSITSRVLGGGESEDGEWPSVVALVRSGTFPLENRLFCGGTIVADRWVMTAAHCLFNAFEEQVRPSTIRVVAGINDLRNDTPDEETIVTNIVVHPKYEHSVDSIIPYDIALLELGTRLEQPAATLFAGESESYTGTLGFIAGWGAVTYIDENTAFYPTTLQDATVPLVSNAVCNDPLSYAGGIVANQLCAGYAEGGVDSCAGDSGGPLFILQNGQQIQVGITGFGNGCALPLFYGIYSNVSHFIPWLSNYIVVPDQSSELVASRQAALYASVAQPSSDEGFFGGSVSFLGLLLLSLISWGRGLQSNVGRAWDKWDIGALCSFLVGIGLASALLTSCAIANAPSEEAMFLIGDEGRAGMRTERLGDDYNRVLSRLNAYYPESPECTSSTVALVGSGRLSMQVLCTAIPDTKKHASELVETSVEYLFLDDQLVRIDVMIAPESLAGLTSTLNSRFTQVKSSPSASEWRSSGAVKDHVRLFTGDKSSAADTTSLRLQLIDGRLEERMPSLFATY